MCRMYGARMPDIHKKSIGPNIYPGVRTRSGPGTNRNKRRETDHLDQ